jgi:hypothetical protein
MNEAPAPTLDDVTDFIREFSGILPSRLLTATTRLDADLNITGDDGQELLEHAARRFDAKLANEADGYRSTFSLGENEYLFHPEGFDLLGVSALISWIMRKPRPLVRDLTIGELHSAILRTRPGRRAA